MNDIVLTGLAQRGIDVLCFGDPVADVVLSVAQVPALGGKVLGRPLGVWAGGTTANVACALARLGMRSGVFGRVGDDAHGSMLRKSFSDFGVVADALETQASTASAQAMTMVAPSGEKALVYMPMAAGQLDQQRLAGAIGQASVVYAMPYDLEEFVLLSRLARNSGTLVAIDIEPAVAPDRAAMMARLACADIVFFNQAGLVAGTGEGPSFAALGDLLACGPRLIVVSLGERGAMAVSATETAQHGAFATQVVDTTGAGDSFNAAFLAAILRGQDLQAALGFACAAASFTVAALGARSGLPGHEAVLALLGSSQC